MNETYVEWLVKRKTPAYMTFLKILSIMLAACFIFVGFIFFPAFLVGLVFGAGAYFIYLNADLEYEYLYVDKELTIDKVMAKSRRKNKRPCDQSFIVRFQGIKSTLSVLSSQRWHGENYLGSSNCSWTFSLCILRGINAAIP